MSKFFSEFKKFISRGNVLDLAVGVIIGGAFQSIVNSLVNDIIMPVIGLLTGGTHFSSWSVTFGKGLVESPATLNYGNFIAAVLNFFIMAFVLFLLVKAINKGRDAFTKKDSTPEPPKTKICPYCKSEVPVDATRCSHCTSNLE